MESPRRDGRMSPEVTRDDSAIVSRTCGVSGFSVTEFLARSRSPRFRWTAPGEPDLVGAGAAARLTADGPDRFDAVRDAATDLFEGRDADGPRVARPRLFGGFAFHDEHRATTPWEEFPGAQFVLPEVQLARTDEGTWLTVSACGSDADPDAVERTLADVRETLTDLPDESAVDEPPRVTASRRTTTREAWNRQVCAAVDRIADGELDKVVLAQALDVSLDRRLRVPALVSRLGSTYPDCHRFLVEPTADAAFFGATPERLVSLRGRTVETGALAGSVPRGETPDEDASLAASLEESEKIRREHGLVADAIRDQLAPLADSVTAGDRTVRKLTGIQHLWTPIAAELSGDEHVASVVEAVHPTPAVGGVPPEEARRTISDTEAFDRGWYAAPIGWFDAAGDGSFAVGIRSAVATDHREGDDRGASTMTLFAGNGIVEGSDPDDEWEEVQLKYRPILDELR